MVLESVIDDSGRRHGRFFVLAGFVLTAHDWVAFADAWQEILDRPPRTQYFKMKEAANSTGQFKRFSTSQTTSRVQAFVSLILSYKPLAVRHVVPNDTYAQVFRGKLARGTDYPYFLSYYNVIGTVFRYLHLQKPNRKDTVDFILELQGERELEAVRRVWRFANESMPAWGNRLVGNKPDHRDDKAFAPLQAADLLAWQTRRFCDTRAEGREYKDPIWRALSSLECAEDEFAGDRLRKIVAGIRAQGRLFEYDVPPQLRKTFKRALREKFEESG